MVATFVSSCGSLARTPNAGRSPSTIVSAATETTAASVAARPVHSTSPVVATPEAPPKYFATLIERARSLSREPDHPAQHGSLPAVLRNLDYSAYRSIRFRPERSLWRGEPGKFEVQFFHLGFYYQDPVRIFVVPRDGERAERVPFSTALFSYDHAPEPPNDAELGFAGMRLHGPINEAEPRDEVIVFQGASYFRTLARGEVYGLSARGLAIDTGEPSGEEFPRFSELYLVRPAADDSATWVLALLESKRATGAYAFHVAPGAETVIDVDAHVFLRAPVKALGLAPLTSMFLFGEAAPARFGDFRPEVHDSDVLALEAANGERIVRPLRNPEHTTVCTFRLDSPRGFGLLQRDRGFASYQDLEARYQDRPSIWIEPRGDWGPGAVRLLEITTKLETDDNIVAAWVPDRPATGADGDGVAYAYRMHVGGVVSGEAPGRVIATRLAQTKHGMRFLVDFSSAADGGGVEGVEPIVTASGGRVIEQHVEANPFAHALRASFEITPQPGAKEVELRAFLRRGNAHGDTHETLTETWSYLWQPAP
jgi:glucans biosynthesis protein